MPRNRIASRPHRPAATALLLLAALACSRRNAGPPPDAGIAAQADSSSPTPETTGTDRDRTDHDAAPADVAPPADPDATARPADDDTPDAEPPGPDAHDAPDAEAADNPAAVEADAMPADAGADGDAPDPVAEAIGRALEPTFPEAAEVAARAEHDGVVFALCKVYRGAIWEAGESDAGTLESSVARWRERTQRCIQEGPAGNVPCDVATAPNPYVGWDYAGIGASVSTFAWEAARLERNDDGSLRATRRVTLVDVSDQSEEPAELRVRDLDGDGRPELTAIVGVALPAASLAEEVVGSLVFILDGDDLHAQFAATRSYHSPEADEYVTTTEQTTWRLADIDGDGRKDLRVRTTGTIEELDTYDDYSAASGRRTYHGSRDCPYDRADDLWNCVPPLLPENEPLHQAARQRGIEFLAAAPRPDGASTP